MRKTNILFTLVILLTTSFSVFAQEPSDTTQIILQNEIETPLDYTKSAADSAYIKENYSEAIAIYEALLEQGVAAEVYYNLGNSYYKAGNIAKAILNYERAVLLAPNNNDYKVNLEIASAKKVDKDIETPEVFLKTWGRGITNLMGSNQWAITSIVFFLVFLSALSAFILSKKALVKRIGFILAVCSIILVPITNYCSSLQKDKILKHNTAIVMEPSVTVRSTPSETGTSLFVIHQGKKVRIKDNSMKSWVEIQLENGQVGWLQSSDIEII